MSIVRYSNPVWNDFVPTSFSALIDRFFNDSLARSGGSTQSFVPRVDVVETDKAYELNVAVPGMNKEDIKVDLNDNVLTISGERKFRNEKNDGNVRILETQYGTFTRAFTLPEDVKTDAIEAHYTNGILEVTVPKDEKKLVKSTIKVR